MFEELQKNFFSICNVQSFMIWYEREESFMNWYEREESLECFHLYVISLK